MLSTHGTNGTRVTHLKVIKIDHGANGGLGGPCLRDPSVFVGFSSYRDRQGAQVHVSDTLFGREHTRKVDRCMKAVIEGSEDEDTVWLGHCSLREVKGKD